MVEYTKNTNEFNKTQLQKNIYLMSTAAERQQSPDFEKKAFNSELFDISVEHASH